MVPSIMTNISLKSSCILLSMFEGERMGGREIDWGRRKDGKGRRRRGWRRERIWRSWRERRERHDFSKILKSVFFIPSSFPVSSFSLLGYDL